MNFQPDRNLTTFLFKPFTYIAGSQALSLGLAAILIAGLIGAFGRTHFDGVLDTHTGAPAPLAVFLAEGLIDWLCLALVLLVCGKIISTTAFRVIDLMGTQALARWPTIFISLVTLPPAIQRFSHDLLQKLAHPGEKIEINTPDAIIFFASALVMLPLIVWMVALMYHSYSVSCNVKGGKAIGTFILALFLAEVLSKIAVYGLFHLI
jgi:hypothetical protein